MPHIHLAAATTALALVFRGLAVLSLSQPHLLPPPLAQYAVPAAFAAYVLGWLKVDHDLKHSKVVAVKAVTHRTTPDGEPLTRAQRKKRRAGGEVRKVSKEVLIRREGEDEMHPVDRPADNLPDPSGPAMVLGIPTTDRTRNRMALVANLVLFLLALDHVWTPKVFLGNHDLSYARTTAIAPNAATVAYRTTADSHLEYRAMNSEDWMSQPLIKSRDHRGEARIEHLIPGLTYEYRILPDSTSYNFTTTPDPLLARETGSHFRFIQTGAPPPPQPWSPMTLPPWNPFRSPHVTPTPSHIAHAYKSHKQRQPAMRQLADWLADMRDRVAWSQYVFGITSGRLEEFGQRERALGMKSPADERATRQFLASRDVRDVYEQLPLLPLTEHSISQGSKLETAALGDPNQFFTYGDAAFYRLRKPYHSHVDGEAQDWQTEVDDLARWAASVNHTSSVKFILSSETLSPFWPAEADQDWQNAVLDVLEYVPNVVVLSERKQGFAALALRERVIEISTPAMDSAKWTNPSAPDVSRAHEVVLTTPKRVEGHFVDEIEFRKIDRVLRWVPGEPGTKWTSIEVDTRSPAPVVNVEFYTNSRKVAKLEIVGSPRRRGSSAVGQVGEGFLAMLRRFGLLPW